LKVNDRIVLYTRVPPDIAVRNWMLVFFFGGLTIWEIFAPNYGRYSEYELWKFALTTNLIIFLIASFQVLMNKGYRLSYDDKAVYFRPDGFNWQLRYRDEWILRYVDIDKIIAEQGQANIQPFEYIALWRATWDGKEEIFVSRMFLREPEIREFLRFLYTKCADKFPDDVIEYMNIPDEPY
jgi:hypothetical protein